ncbi:prepilin-type N-terminal cleavage/methylation domain-containing protein [uncultured Ilyobacter sp.]|uniref:type II secretion system protein n=1 Tax=uncultured Ilyobacter sp. TaxID=544433 RepID=UPI002AA88D19|nr:prepilin-type N-terminal cleavage/methylation domain-containing protein [uncultured Ilyobacter sp.]
MNKAFTLIELMIALFVISLVSAIAIPKYSNLTSESKVANVQANLSNLNTAIEMYNLKNFYIQSWKEIRQHLYIRK